MLTITLRAAARGQAPVESVKSAGAARRYGGGMAVATGMALAASLFATSGALAQNCAVTNTASGGVPLGTGAGIAGTPASISSMIGSSITAADTAFLLQSEAFIGAPANPGPNQQGGGVWGRAVGGQVDIKSTTTATGFVPSTPPNPPGLVTTTLNCSQKVDSTFAGVQFGADIAKLNLNGWNLHFGGTAGFIGSRGNLVGGALSFQDLNTGAGPGSPTVGGGPFTSSTQVPFIGVYAAATNGGFFVDGLLRAQYSQTTLNSPGEFLFGQQLDAHGWAFAGSTGYNWAVPNSNWFIEPSAGVSISRTKLDPFNYLTTGIPGATTFGETLQVNQINSDIGRLGLRVGETIQAGNIVWQPFGAFSVWHEFGPNITANAVTCPGMTAAQSCAFFGGPSSFTASSSTSTFGTYEQYSLGVSAALAGTGWLGFARVDYRDGPNLQGLSGTGGIRYQFSPDVAVAHAMPVKAPVYKAPVMTAVNWTGFYLGGFGGATLGRADWGYAGGEVSPHIGGYLFGGDIGYNYQIDRWVIGLEGDLGGTNTKGGVACAPLVAGTGIFPTPNAAPMYQMTCKASDTWLATAAARVGYTWERALFYVKAGGAWTNERFSATCNLAPGVNITAGQQCTNPYSALSSGLSANTNRGGWTIGYGTEFALTPNWSVKAETDYVSFGDSNVTATDGSALKVGMHLWEEKIGLNYRFSPGPVMAKY